MPALKNGMGMSEGYLWKLTFALNAYWAECGYVIYYIFIVGGYEK